MALNDDEQRKLEEARRKAEEEEARRLEEEVARRTEGLQKLRQKRQDTKREEEQLRKREAEQQAKAPPRPGADRPPYAEEKPGVRDEASLVEKAIQEGGKRKLAAIMFTDIKGFSKKMGQNESAAMELLKIHNETMEKIIARHSGTVVKSIGDSFMVDFSSAVNAVKCAIEVQETFWNYNQGKSEFDEIQVRIGVHLGDVIGVGKDIFGDGVNIASRIEAIAEPGRICISQDVYHQVKNKMNLQAVSAGAVTLKNIAEPIEVFQVLIESIPELAKPSQLVQQALERRQQEEVARKEREEAERTEAIKKKTEEELRRREEEIRRRREEEERRKREREEQARREEEERQRQTEEEERIRREQEEKERIANTLKAAEEQLAQNAFDAALAELEPVLATDPMHTEALTLKEKIQTAKASFEAEQAKAAEEAAIQAAVEAAPKPAEEVAELKKEKRPASKKSYKGLIVSAVGAVVIAVAGVVIFQLTQSLFEGNRYIAVFPFTSAANSPEERTLGTAIAHETATLLGYASNARILDPSTAVNLHRTTRNPEQQANKFNFIFTVKGSISMTGTMINATVEIIDTAGNKLWTGKVEKPRDRLAELVGEIAGKIAETFTLTLDNTRLESSASKADAYLTYLRSRDLIYGDRSALREARRLFLEASTTDPRFAEAYAAAAHVHFHMYETGMETDERLLTEAETLARKALEIRPTLAEAHAVLGGVAIFHKRYSAAISSLQKALELMPSNSETLRLLSLVYAISGTGDQALDYATRADELNPADADVLTTSALVHQRFGKAKEAMAYFDRALPYISDTSTYLATTAGNTLLASYQYDRAIALFEKRVALNPRNYVDHYKLARAYQLAGKGFPVWSKAFEKTIAVIQQELQSRPQDARAAVYLALALSRYGRYQEAEESGKRALRLSPDDLTIKYKIADMYSIQKKKDEALKALRDAVATRYILEEIVDLDLFNVSEESEFLPTISLPLN